MKVKGGFDLTKEIRVIEQSPHGLPHCIKQYWETRLYLSDYEILSVSKLRKKVEASQEYPIFIHSWSK